MQHGVHFLSVLAGLNNVQEELFYYPLVLAATSANKSFALKFWDLIISKPYGAFGSCLVGWLILVHNFTQYHSWGIAIMRYGRAACPRALNVRPGALKCPFGCPPNALSSICIWPSMPPLCASFIQNVLTLTGSLIYQEKMWPIQTLSSINYTPGIYAEGYIVFVFPFVCSYVCLFVLPSCSWNYFKVLRSSNSSGVYLTNHSSESIHIWTIGTLEGRLSFHDSSPQGPCPGVGLEVKI